jgi:hypothetical protein
MNLKLATAVVAVLLASSWPTTAQSDAVPDAPPADVAPSNVVPCRIVVQTDPDTVRPADVVPIDCRPQVSLAFLLNLVTSLVDKVPCGQTGKPKCDQYAHDYVCQIRNVDCSPEPPGLCPEDQLGLIVDGEPYCIDSHVNGLPCGGPDELSCDEYVCDLGPPATEDCDLPTPEIHPCDSGIGYAVGTPGIPICIHPPSQVPPVPCGEGDKPDCETYACNEMERHPGPGCRVPDLNCNTVLAHCFTDYCEQAIGDATCGAGTADGQVEELEPAVLILAGVTYLGGPFMLQQSIPLPDGTWETRAMASGSSEANVQCGAMELGYAHAEDMTCEKYFPLANVDTMWLYYGAPGCDCATTGSTKNYMNHQHADGSAHGKGWRVNWGNGYALEGKKCQEYSGQGGKVLHADWMFGGISTDSSGYCNTPNNPAAYPYGYWGAGLTFK